MERVSCEDAGGLCGSDDVQKCNETVGGTIYLTVTAHAPN